MLIWLLLGLGLLGFIFRRKLMARLAEAMPDREARHRVVGAIIAAFLILIAIRLGVRLIWG